jgi:hypothetical protein
MVTMFSVATPSSAQQPPDGFRWVDFHSAKEADTVAWVTRSLDQQQWTAIREIGVEYDAALVVTSLRATPQSAANMDQFSVWSVSLTSHVVAPILKGVNLRLLGWTIFAAGRSPELAALYDDCNECSAATFFTAFHYDLAHHQWIARWMNVNRAAPVWSTNTLDGVNWSQVYALLLSPDGSHQLATWNHFDYGKQKPPEDSIFTYDVDPATGEDRTEAVKADLIVQLEQRLCLTQAALPGLARGQDAAICQSWIKSRPVRKPVTTPPANNEGQSAPPGGTKGKKAKPQKERAPATTSPAGNPNQPAPPTVWPPPDVQH